MLHRCGTLHIGDFVLSMKDEMDKIKVSANMMTSDEVHLTFPGIQVKDPTLPILFEPNNSGFVESDNVIKSHVQLAKVLFCRSTLS